MNTSTNPVRIKLGLDIGYSGVKIAHGSGRAPAVLNLPIGTAPVERAANAPDGSCSLSSTARAA